MKNLSKLLGVTALVAGAMFMPGMTDTASACTRVTFVGDSGIVITGRSLDWRTTIPTNVYVFPAVCTARVTMCPKSP